MKQPGFLLLPAVEDVCDIQMGWEGLARCVCLGTIPGGGTATLRAPFLNNYPAQSPQTVGRASEGVAPCVFTFKGAVLELPNTHGEI